MSTRRCSWVRTVGIALAVFPPASSLAAKTSAVRELALFPFVSSGAPNRVALSQVRRVLFELSTRLRWTSVLDAHKLKERLGRDPRRSMMRCGSDIACIAALGRDVGASDVLIGRAKDRGGTTELTVLTVNTEQRRVTHVAVLSLDATGAVSTTVIDELWQVLGASPEVQPSPPDSADASGDEAEQLRGQDPPGSIQAKEYEGVAISVLSEPGPAQRVPSEPYLRQRQGLAARPVALYSAGVASVGAGLATAVAGTYLYAQTADQHSDLRGPTFAAAGAVLLGVGLCLLALDWHWYGPIWASGEQP